LSVDITNILVSSCAQNTQSQYKLYIQRWLAYCNNHNIILSKVCVNNVLEFLYSVYVSGVGYSSVNTARSALSFFLPYIEGFSVGQHPLVIRFVKGIYKLRPPRPRYNYTWDVNLLLNMFREWSNNDLLSRERLTLKLVSLLAIVTAQRVQSINLIKLSNMLIEGNRLLIKIPDIIKTSRPGGIQPLFVFPPYHESKLCLKSVILTYIKYTMNVRKDDELLLGLEQPYSKISNQTVSRWLKKCLMLAGIDSEIFKGHSYRHASTSKAFNQGCNIDVIFNKAGWAHNSTVFAKFYNRQICEDNYMDMILS
jgi:site-specific recombinase XerD